MGGRTRIQRPAGGVQDVTQVAAARPAPRLRPQQVRHPFTVQAMTGCQRKQLHEATRIAQTPPVFPDNSVAHRNPEAAEQPDAHGLGVCLPACRLPPSYRAKVLRHLRDLLSVSTLDGTSVGKVGVLSISPPLGERSLPSLYTSTVSTKSPKSIADIIQQSEVLHHLATHRSRYLLSLQIGCERQRPALPADQDPVPASGKRYAVLHCSSRGTF